MFRKTLYTLLFCLILGGCSQEKDYRVIFHTRYGDMEAVLFDVTPRHKENFIKLAKNGQYDSVAFHRVIEDFMIQTGDPMTRPGATKQDSVAYTIEPEFVDTLFHRRGAIGAARQGDQFNPKRASNGSQFYIIQGTTFTEDELTTDMDKLNKGISTLIEHDYNYAYLEEELTDLYNSGDFTAYTKRILDLKPTVEEALNINVDKKYSAERLEVYATVGGAPHLDDTYTVFGQVVKGLAVVDSIAAQPVDSTGDPLQEIYVTVELKETPKSELKRLYNFN